MLNLKTHESEPESQLNWQPPHISTYPPHPVAAIQEANELSVDDKHWCSECGKPIADNSNTAVRYAGHWFCDDACERAFGRKHGYVRITYLCPECHGRCALSSDGIATCDDCGCETFADQCVIGYCRPTLQEFSHDNPEITTGAILFIMISIGSIMVLNGMSFQWSFGLMLAVGFAISAWSFRT